MNDLRLAREDALVALKTIKSRQPVGAVEWSRFFHPGKVDRLREKRVEPKKYVWLLEEFF